ncbi:hypothetical protein KCH_42800 [Kitasatospora cheerisanensis KCTC 2395]|uniref:Uncharacterized protein n=1 Tax=Kitasatospora cheerisanensis KCTC 2395 TaxID=1348663 RepID=A0A066YWX5_9ACTN|nr:hypothetical protein KCH_42800 [Kitasatospora cheerisanensis KCTC 2395]
MPTSPEAPRPGHPNGHCAPWRALPTPVGPTSAHYLPRMAPGQSHRCHRVAGARTGTIGGPKHNPTIVQGSSPQKWTTRRRERTDPAPTPDKTPTAHAAAPARPTLEQPFPGPDSDRSGPDCGQEPSTGCVIGGT